METQEKETLLVALTAKLLCRNSSAESKKTMKFSADEAYTGHGLLHLETERYVTRIYMNTLTERVDSIA